MLVDRGQLERDIRLRCEQGDTSAAVALVIRGYGPEILGFLHAIRKNQQDAEDVFSIVCERVLRGMPAFAWECSARTWLYTIARNASSSFHRDARVRAQRERPLPDGSDLSRLAQEVRSETSPYQRTEVKNKFVELRDSLAPEERALLILRLDKRLEWKDIARIMLDEKDPVDDLRLRRESQRLRKQFQGLKERLVEVGRSAGLIDTPEK